VIWPILGTSRRVEYDRVAGADGHSARAPRSPTLLRGVYQQTSLTGNVFGPYTISISNAGCDYYGIAMEAEQAATAAASARPIPARGTPFLERLRLVGARHRRRYPSWRDQWQLQNGVVAHEMGHNLGLYPPCRARRRHHRGELHQRGLRHPRRHGSAAAHDFNAAQKERLGWLGYGASPPITTVQSSGVYTIDPYESTGSAPKALKVLSSAGEWYYVEYRQAIGFDASTVTGNPNVRNGVVVHLMDGTNANGIYLLDMTPATASWSDPALGVDQSFVDVAGGITISPQWTDGTNAGVSITLGPSTCVRQNPSVVISPAQQQGAAWRDVCRVRDQQRYRAQPPSLRA
jgi:hypothetical protein